MSRQLCFLILILIISSCRPADTVQNKNTVQPIKISPSPVESRIQEDTTSPTTPLAKISPSLPTVMTPTPSPSPPGYFGIQPPHNGKIYRFESELSNRSLPKDLIQELMYTPSGGGEFWPCEEIQTTLNIYTKYKIVQLGEWIDYVICGPMDQEFEIDLSIITPDGNRIQKKIDLHRETASGSQLLKLTDSIGTYQLIVSDGKTSSETNVKVVSPIGPKMALNEWENWIYLYNFQPRERIRLLNYGPSNDPFYLLNFYGWEEYFADDQGILFVEYIPMEIIFSKWFAVGDDSGETQPVNGIGGTNVWSKSFCPDAPYTRMNVGGRGYVCTVQDRLIVRKGPNRTHKEATRLDPWANFIVLEGPACANQLSWWEILTDDEIVGWVAEGGGSDEYFICPSY